MLEEKIEALTKEVVALRQVIEKGGLSTTKAAEKAKPASKAKAKAKDADDEDEEADEDEDDAPSTKKKSAGKSKAKAKEVEPDHDEDEVGTMFRKAAKIDKPKCKKYLKKVDCEDLAELLTKPELYDAAFDFAEAIVDAEDEDEEDDD